MLGDTDPLSRETVRLDAYLRGKHIYWGSGFLVRRRGDAEGEMTLVTAWHMMTGRLPRDPSRTMPGVPDAPDRIEVHCFRQDPDVVTLGTSAVAHSIESFDFNPRITPWHEHPDRESLGVDIVAVPLQVGTLVAREGFLPDLRMASIVPTPGLQPGADVFVVGHLLKHSPPGLPIWKRGTVASEPQLDFDGSPCFLVDARTSSGMSGSPVYLSTDTRVERLADGTKKALAEVASGVPHRFNPNAFNPLWPERGVARLLVGVYTARVSDGGNDLADIGLGKVWRLDALAAVLDTDGPPQSGFDPEV